MRRVLLPILGFLVVGFAHAGGPAAGRFRLHVPEEALRVARLAGKPTPSGRLALLADGTFVLQADGATRRGVYRNEGGGLVLIADDGTELRGEVKEDGVVVEGLAFERETLSDLAGTWTTRRNGQEERGVRMELKKDGTFRFVMAGATSEGTWSAEDGKLALVWTKIDGEAVDPGTVKKEFPVGEDGASFRIDTYRYERATAQEAPSLSVMAQKV